MALRTNRIALDAVPCGSQTDSWREALAAIYFDTLLPAGFGNGELITKSSPGGTRLSLLRSTPQVMLNRGAARTSGPVALLYQAEGRAHLAGSSEVSELYGGDAAVLDLATPWRLEQREDFVLLVLEMPRDLLLDRLRHTQVTLPRLLTRSGTAAGARALMRSFTDEFASLDQRELPSAEIALTELATAALLSDAASGAATSSQAGHLRRIHALVEARLGESDLSIAAVARHEGLSPRYVQRLFERQDTTFSTYLRDRRLKRCSLELADPKYADQSIAQISFRWGFHDQAYFSRAFSAALGISPREFRKKIVRAPQPPANRGRPSRPYPPRSAVKTVSLPSRGTIHSSAPASRTAEPASSEPLRHHLAVSKDVVHWGYLSRALPPVLDVDPGAIVTIETLTQHAFDDYERMIAGDPGAESVFAWTPLGKAVDRRGAGPMNGSIYGRGAGEGFGVHICTGPVHVRGAEPGDVLEVEILDIRPRPCANPRFAGKAFGSNAAAWWGFHYNDLVERASPREVVTIFETDLTEGARFARAVHSYRWTPQTDPFGVLHATMDYPGVPVDHATVDLRTNILADIRIPARPHFGFIGVAPREADIVDSIPPGYFGGNVDNWRAGPGSRLYLPVAVSGALLSVGDPHFAQGDGEVSGTALELSLTGELRLVLHKKDGSNKPFTAGLGAPLLETPDAWVLQGFSYPNYLRELGRQAQSEIYKKSSIDLAMRHAFRATRKFLMEHYRLTEDEAIALMSLAVDFGVTQVADGNWGVHAVIDKRLLAHEDERVQ
ncbi:MAG: acetamidase/formamidase family protein [Hyphomicrobiales bacterium]|nr:acetamidase/formamidase family protein [Hyphomicrobiales bacterium]